jgi:hypothetical protein
MSQPSPVSYEYALSLLCDLSTPSPGPDVGRLVGFVADLFHVPQSRVKEEVEQRVADQARNAAAYMAQSQAQPEADLYGDNSLDGD